MPERTALQAPQALPDWPRPPELGEPAPPASRRAWGKVPYEERYRRQRRALLRACAAIAGRKGYHGTRVADIVAEAGLSKATFYEHFSSKEDCFLELYRRTNAAMLRAGIEAAERHAHLGPFAAMLAVVRALTGYVARDPRLAEVLRVELADTKPAVAAQRRENRQRIVELFVVLARRHGSPLPDEELRLAATIMVQGTTVVFPELARGRSLDEHLVWIARAGCRALGLPCP